MDGKCKKCAFWTKIDDGKDNGYCRRFPPVFPFGSPSLPGNPVTDEKYVCGEFKEKP
jgi:hypothetical protein